MAPQWLFESFRLDPVNACLWRGTAVVPMQPKVFDLLHYLVTHPHRLVRKDELLEAVWPATAVSDAVIRMAVGALRQALDDSAQMPRCIATVPRRGYRFIAAVTPVEPPTPLTPRPEVPLGLGRPLTPQSARVPLVLTPPILGEPSPLAPTAPASERKQVTVLCADITDAMARIRTLDPEAAQHLLDPILQRMIDAVHHYEGTVNQMLGDGLMALFGAPVAQEDHALRACYAALAMQAALRACAGEVHRAHGLTVQVRVGLNAGEVVVRPRRHDGQLEYSAVG